MFINIKGSTRKRHKELLLIMNDCWLIDLFIFSCVAPGAWSGGGAPDSGGGAERAAPNETRLHAGLCPQGGDTARRGQSSHMVTFPNQIFLLPYISLHRYFFPSQTFPFSDIFPPTYISFSGHFPSQAFPLLNISPPKHFPSKTYPFPNISLPRHFPFQIFPFSNISFPRHFPSQTFPFPNISLPRHFPSQTFPFSEISPSQTFSLPNMSLPRPNQCNIYLQISCHNFLALSARSSPPPPAVWSCDHKVKRGRD